MEDDRFDASIFFIRSRPPSEKPCSIAMNDKFVIVIIIIIIYHLNHLKHEHNRMVGRDKGNIYHGYKCL